MVRTKTTFFYAGAVIILLFFLSPLFWLVSTSFKNYKDAFAVPPVLIFTPTFENYQNVFARSDFFAAFANSLMISVVSTLLCLCLASITAYALANFPIRKKMNMITFILSSRVAPPILMLLPVYFIAVKVGLTDSYLLLIIVYMLMNLPFAILMLLTFFEDIPGEIREAAFVDGCSEFKTFLSVILPIARGGIAATFILSMVFVWNEFLISLVLAGKTTQTLPVLITSFMTFQGTEWGPLTATGTFIMLPMLIFGLSVQKHLVKGMTMGAVK
ncbi:sugar ABC transporter permease [Gordoniibacillus kamchatkensis]|uniref:Sugar ABC transporter permease n=1 Tax=Gordoniibacillus kamchatkensis TaxID=1590651 RepID=A0ABR5AEN0_9BACL|nr:carbohydrate ABC transporter permease [Paenibacillus sp. VKM B-2647]KIL39123.1 sugar ABC transporter permease [Paenibacillus sp. VKM B-2647]